ncbi:MAG: hypothetical protein MZV70_07795 [Desulfobacterales bacterium]|nr:hypothetical protein [Desulfobacterales bacterium]
MSPCYWGGAHARSTTVRIALILFAALPAFLLAAGDEADLAIVAKIRHEGIKRSQVMRLAGYLSDVIGPRPAGSPANDRANRWAADTMKGWGLENVALEPYEQLRRRLGAALRFGAPALAPLRAAPGDFGRMGLVHEGQDHRRAALRLASPTPADFARYRGKLKGRIVLYQPPRGTAPHFTADARRHDARQPRGARRLSRSRTRTRRAPTTCGASWTSSRSSSAPKDVGVLVSPSSGGRGDYGTTVATGIRSARHPDRRAPAARDHPRRRALQPHRPHHRRVPRAGGDGGGGPHRSSTTRTFAATTSSPRFPAPTRRTRS